MHGSGWAGPRIAASGALFVRGRFVPQERASGVLDVRPRVSKEIAASRHVPHAPTAEGRTRRLLTVGCAVREEAPMSAADLSPELRDFVVRTAETGASHQLALIDENFLDHEAFDPRPKDEAGLRAAWQAFCEAEDEPWWHLWEAVSDELSEDTRPAAKKLLVETFDAQILAGLRAHLGL